MEQQYLPGTLRTRILDLMKEYKVTQSDLALRIGMSESTLSRFLRSNSDKLSSEQVLQIARVFNVSTDFLLGVSLLMGQAKQNPELSETAATVSKMINYSKTPVYQADITNIQNQFMAVIKEIKKEIGSDLELQKSLSKQVTEQMFRELTKGQDLLHLTITPEQLADAVTGTVANTEALNPKKLNALNHALVELFQTKPKDDTHENDE